MDDLTPLARLARKLSRLADLDSDDVGALLALPMDFQRVPRFEQLICEGRSPDRCCLLVRGYAARYKEAASGLRQIVSFHFAGDLLDIQHLLLAEADHSVQTISPAEIAWIPKGELLRLAWQREAIGRALWRDCLIDASIFREWVLNVGRRDARSRIAHMLCEFVARCEMAGVGSRESFHFPMTQEQVADATGMTPVHVNRMLKVLDQERAIARHRNEFSIRDWKRLCSIAGFDPAYLHQASKDCLDKRSVAA